MLDVHIGHDRASRFTARCLLAAASVVLLAIGIGSALAQPADPTQAIAAENAALSAQIEATTLELGHARKRLARLERTREDLDAGMSRIEEYAKLPGLGRVFVETVMERLRVLPRPESYASRESRRELLVATSDERLRSERALQELADLDVAVARRIPDTAHRAPHPRAAGFEANVRSLLGTQRELLTRLTAERHQLLETLHSISDAERKLAARSQAARAELSRLLFWVPVRPGWSAAAETGHALAWTLSPANWLEAAAAVGAGRGHASHWPLVALVAAALLFAARGYLWPKIAALAPSAVGYERYRARHALAALAITFAVALPLPIAMRALAALLHGAPDAQTFTRALGDVLWRIGPLLLGLGGAAALLDRRGMGVHHFGWDEASLEFAARAVRRFAAVFVPVVFVAGLNGLDHAPFANRESLGRAANVVAMIVLAAFLVRLLRMRSPVMQRFAARAPRSWAVRLHPVWFGFVLAVPLGLAALSIAGYFVAAVYFFGRVAYSLYVVLGAMLLYGLVALWVQLKGSQLVRRDEEQVGRQGGAAVAGQLVPLLPGRRPVADPAAIGAQTRALLDLVVTLIVLIGLWWVWKDSVPALAEIADYQLWTYHETVDGKQITRPLTLGHLSLALLVGVVTAVAVRNIGALLDIVLLQRLEVQADATYALKVTTQYALVAGGVILAANVLGMDWSDVQWLVAALGVGLGFGLQEIFGNFVAGIIVLAERPVRLGDVITIGDVSGTVTRIRARVITVVDFDNKEVLIPNKSLITDRVVNWTLSSQTTRLVIKANIASESDPELAQRVILEAVRANPDVAREPAPRVFFVGFGPGARTLEISAFVDSFAKRERVQHEINVAVDQALREHGIRTV